MVPGTMERFLEVNEGMMELLLVFQIFFDQPPQVEYLFSSIPQKSETCQFLFQDLFYLVYQPVQNHLQHDLAWVTNQAHRSGVLA